VEYDAFAFPLTSNDPLNQRTEIFAHPPRNGANAQVSVKGRVGQSFQIETSTNLTQWVILGTNTLRSAIGIPESPGSQHHTKGFFRYLLK